MEIRLLGAVMLTSALEALGHWFPWPRRLHRIAAYVWGTTSILAGLLLITERRTYLRTLLVCTTAGATTIATYIVDIHLHARQRRRMHGHNS